MIGGATLTPPVLAAFALLGVALALLWAPRLSSSPGAARWWTAPLALAVVAALAGGVLDWRGLAVLLLLGVAGHAARTSTVPALNTAAHALMFAVTAGLFVHLWPGFANPRVLEGVRLAPDSLPYTKYLNFDKGAAALLVLGLYAPGRAARRSRGTAAGWAWRFAVIAVVVIAATVSLGYARWDPKLPSWWPMWLAGMVFLTALPEETLFRAVIQEALHERLGESTRARWLAAVIAGAVFGIAHAGGGCTYVVAVDHRRHRLRVDLRREPLAGRLDRRAHGAQPAAPAVLQLSRAAPHRLDSGFDCA